MVRRVSYLCDPRWRQAALPSRPIDINIKPIRICTIYLQIAGAGIGIDGPAKPSIQFIMLGRTVVKNNVSQWTEKPLVKATPSLRSGDVVLIQRIVR
jgi:hypothetical protein